jgi:hypothetical protein
LQLSRRTDHVETWSPPYVFQHTYCSRVRAERLLRLDAVFDVVLALVLLGSSWDDLYEFFGVPVPKPAFYAQLLGAALIGFAVIEWRLASRPGQREVALGGAAASALGGAILFVWLVSGRIEPELQGEILLWLLVVLLAAAAVLHARLARRGAP